MRSLMKALSYKGQANSFLSSSTLFTWVTLPTHVTIVLVDCHVLEKENIVYQGKTGLEARRWRHPSYFSLPLLCVTAFTILTQPTHVLERASSSGVACMKWVRKGKIYGSREQVRRARKEERVRDSSKSRTLLVFSVQSLCSKERAVLP